MEISGTTSLRFSERDKLIIKRLRSHSGLNLISLIRAAFYALAREWKVSLDDIEDDLSKAS